LNTVNLSAMCEDTLDDLIKQRNLYLSQQAKEMSEQALISPSE